MKEMRDVFQWLSGATVGALLFITLLGTLHQAITHAAFVAGLVIAIITAVVGMIVTIKSYGKKIETK